MFPSLAPNLEQQLNIMQNKEEIKPVGRSFKFDFTKKEFIFSNGKIKEVDNLQAIKQWIELCLRTYKDKFNVYKGEEFGCNIEDLLGQKLNNLTKAHLDFEIRESLKKSVQISEIIKTNYTQERGIITIDIEVELKDGNIVKVVV